MSRTGEAEEAGDLKVCERKGGEEGVSGKVSVTNRQQGACRRSRRPSRARGVRRGERRGVRGKV